MMNCKQCGAELLNKREDAIFCNENCKQKHYKRRKKITNEIESLKRAIRRENQIIEHWENKVAEDKRKRNLKGDLIQESISKKTKTLNYCKNVLSKKLDGAFIDFLANLFQSNPDKYWRELEIFEYGNDRELFRVVRLHRVRYEKNAAMLKNELEKLKAKQIKNSLDNISFGPTELEKEANRIIEKCKIEIVDFENRLKEVEEIDLDRLPIIPSRKINSRMPKRVSGTQSYTGREIANIDHDFIQLNDDLGRFLGKLERNKCAIALTGDSGAGKSHFSYTLANGFLDQNQTVGYFTLESGFNSKFKKFAEKHSNNRNFRAFEEASLSDVRTEAKNFDCLIIDSYSKISSKAADFESLRQDFPNTFFIIIFQKTTDGKIRGGSSILFNSTATIDIRINEDGERIAVMVKSRYDTENFIYSIASRSLIKDNKMPLK